MVTGRSGSAKKRKDKKRKNGQRGYRRKMQKIERADSLLANDLDKGMTKHVKMFIKGKGWQWMTMYKGAKEMNTKGKKLAKAHLNLLKGTNPVFERVWNTLQPWIAKEYATRRSNVTGRIKETFMSK